MSEEHRSFADPDTHFILVRAPETDHDVGMYEGQHLGVVVCPFCLGSNLNSDHIGHEPNCPQVNVRSEWYWQTRGASQPDSDQ